MTNKLKESVKNYLEPKKLNKQQMDELKKLMHQSVEETPRAKFLKANLVAAFLIVVIASSIFWVQMKENNIDVAQLIAEEVAYNHVKMKPMEVSSASLDDVRSYFSKLDFSLSSSQFVADNDLVLMGGRYCSIQGNAAAQLRMKDGETGNVQIVYQAPYDKELFRSLPNLYEGQTPIRHHVNGIAVDVWVEQGILFARSFKPSQL